MGATYVFAKDAAAPEFDRSLAWAALLLMAIGLVMVYSASIATAETSRNSGSNAAYYLLRHTVFLGAALAAAVAVFLLPVRYWQRGAPWLFLAGVVLLVLTSEYRMQRIFGFMDPWTDPFGRGYQLSHALIAFGRGEWLGVGLGASVEKLHYLPEAHTDFLLAVIAEELGLLGVASVIALFVWVVLRAFAIGRQAALRERHFASLAAQGIGVWIGFQALINMGVNMGLLPTKGLTLPFLSFGGSGIVANCVALAILLRLDWENRRVLRGFAV